MSDLLAVIGPGQSDSDLLDELARRHPDRITVLLEDGGADWATDGSLAGIARRDRLATLLSAIEDRTGATVLGLAGGVDQLEGWRFDRVVRARAGERIAA
jgi:hypothetical protein